MKIFLYCSHDCVFFSGTFRRTGDFGKFKTERFEFAVVRTENQQKLTYMGDYVMRKWRVWKSGLSLITRWNYLEISEANLLEKGHVIKTFKAGRPGNVLEGGWHKRF